MKFAIIIASVTGGLLLLTIIVTALFGGGNTPTPPQGSLSPAPIQPQTYTAPSADATPAPGKSLIVGEICPPTQGGTVVSQGMVVAEEIPSRIKHVVFYPGETVAGTRQFAIELEPGTYELYSQTLQHEKVALFSEYVRCGMGEACYNHTLLQVSLEPNQKYTEARICDYTWTKPAVLPPSPTPDFSPLGTTPTPNSGIRSTPTRTF